MLINSIDASFKGTNIISHKSVNVAVDVLHKLEFTASYVQGSASNIFFICG